MTIAQKANHTVSIMQKHTEKIMLEQRDEIFGEEGTIWAMALTIEAMATQTESMLLAQERGAAMVVERMPETESLVAKQACLQEVSEIVC